MLCAVMYCAILCSIVLCYVTAKVCSAVCTEEKDMDTVVAIHNNMNENTWAQLLAWEKLHPVCPPSSCQFLSIASLSVCPLLGSARLSAQIPLSY